MTPVTESRLPLWPQKKQKTENKMHTHPPTHPHVHTHTHVERPLILSAYWLMEFIYFYFELKLIQLYKIRSNVEGELQNYKNSKKKKKKKKERNNVFFLFFRFSLSKKEK